MAYKTHWLLSFGGHQGHIEEIWTCGIRLAVFGDTGPVFDVDEEQYLTNTAMPALSAWFARADSMVTTQARMTWIKFNEIGPDGRYADQTQTHERQGLNYAGGASSTAFHPLQVALVLSWRTDATERGPGSKGRIYSPRPMVSIDLNGDVSGAQRVSVAASAVTLLNSLDTAIGDPLLGAVLRPCIASKVGEGHLNQIDRVVVDSSLDIQRRRSNHQSKETTTATVTY